jgi:hypothetical protein
MSAGLILPVSNNRSRISDGPWAPYCAHRRDVRSLIPRSRAAAAAARDPDLAHGIEHAGIVAAISPGLDEHETFDAEQLGERRDSRRAARAAERNAGFPSLQIRKGSVPPGRIYGNARRLIDGEAIAYADDGLASFELLRGRHHERLVALCAFDLLELDERDLCCTPLEDRERVLARLALSLRPLARLDQDDVLLAKSGRWGAYGEHRLNQRGRVAKAWRD